MAQLETLQDIYIKIADIYDKFCNLNVDIQTSVVDNITVLEYDWTAPLIQLDNPNGLAEISNAQQEINEAIEVTFNLVYNLENDYVQALGDGDLVPIPKGGALVWLPKLIAILVGYRAPLKFIASLIIDILKDVLLDELKKRLNRKKQFLYGTINLNASASFQIPYDAEGLVIACSNIPDWYGKRFDTIGSGAFEKFNSILGTFGLGFRAEFSTDVYLESDYRVAYKQQWFNLKDSQGINYRYGTLYLNNQITAVVKFVRSL